jgi:hypothetical protein
MPIHRKGETLGLKPIGRFGIFHDQLFGIKLHPKTLETNWHDHADPIMSICKLPMANPQTDETDVPPV